MNFKIATINDIYKIQYIYDKYNHIYIDTKKLKYTGTLRYAFKYALWALNIGGKLTINDEPFENQGFSTKRIDFWQIRHEFFKSLKDDIELIGLDDKKGYIEAVKTKDSYMNNGFSFGIVFSGNDNEVDQLTKSIQSILINENIDNYSYEIIICGPLNFDSNSYIAQFKNSKIRYLAFDFEPNAKRFMITQKKNYLYSHCKYNVVAINHTRIVYAIDFMHKTFNKKFDVFTPKIMVEQDGKWYKYLDFGLIGSYDLSKLNRSAVLTSVVLNDDTLFFMSKKVPYLDGGLTVFNKEIIINTPYNSHLSWGEAEDVDMCGLLYFQGYLLDYDENIVHKSLTNKTSFKIDYKFKIKKILRDYLVKKGFY